MAEVVHIQSELLIASIAVTAFLSQHITVDVINFDGLKADAIDWHESIGAAFTGNW